MQWSKVHIKKACVSVGHSPNAPFDCKDFFTEQNVILLIWTSKGQAYFFFVPSQRPEFCILPRTKGEGSSIFGRLQGTSLQQSYSVSSQAAAQAVSSSSTQCCKVSVYWDRRKSFFPGFGDTMFTSFSWTLKGICSFFMCHYKSGLRVCEQKQTVHVNQVPSSIKWALKVSKCEPMILELWMKPSCQRQCFQCFQPDLGAGNRAGCTQMPPGKTSGEFL